MDETSEKTSTHSFLTLSIVEAIALILLVIDCVWQLFFIQKMKREYAELKTVYERIQKTSSDSVEPGSPEDVVTRFYTWYITDPTHPNASSEDSFATTGYVSDRFINEIRQLRSLPFGKRPNYDPILCAQDRPDRIFVGFPESNSETGKAYVAVTENFIGNNTVDVDLIRSNDGQWKINRVGCRLESPDPLKEYFKRIP